MKNDGRMDSHRPFFNFNSFSNKLQEQDNMKLRIALLTAALFCGLQLSAQDKTIYVNLETIFENFYKTVNANIAFEDQKKDFEARVMTKKSATISSHAKRAKPASAASRQSSNASAPKSANSTRTTKRVSAISSASA